MSGNRANSFGRTWRPETATVLYFSQNDVFGAAEQYLADLAAGLAARGFRAEVICRDNSALNKFEALRANGVEVHRLPEHFFTGNAAVAVPGIARLMLRLKPALVHFNDPCTLGILGASLARVGPRVMTYHTPELVRRHNWKGRLLERFAFRHVTHTIYLAMRNRLIGVERDALPAELSSVIHLGVRLSDYADSLRAERARIRTELGIGLDARTVINVGRLSSQKAHLDLIEAARVVRSRHPDVVFVVAGEGELRTEIEARLAAVNMVDRFLLLGHRVDIPRLLAASDLFALSSTFEGGCYAVIEAMASGLAVVSTDVGGMSETVVDGVTGFLVPPGNPPAMTAALDRILSSPGLAEAMGRDGRRRVEQDFEMDQMVDRTCEVYRRVLGIGPESLADGVAGDRAAHAVGRLGGREGA